MKRPTLQVQRSRKRPAAERPRSVRYRKKTQIENCRRLRPKERENYFFNSGVVFCLTGYSQEERKESMLPEKEEVIYGEVSMIHKTEIKGTEFMDLENKFLLELAPYNKMNVVDCFNADTTLSVIMEQGDKKCLCTFASVKKNGSDIKGFIRKGGVEKPKGPLEALRPKLQPTQQQTRYRKSPCAPTDGEGMSYVL
ncbi:hypothetical protein E3N88_34173 [Mikania micrantha]|uniref:Uncharacterized protein n=1 Tax=Mikania micrantha TaxID=192012 RepID=A0A5N6MDX1_9ASTR|nr:hypothetical protein E3N88_34173 [Mikania micrantha]